MKQSLVLILSVLCFVLPAFSDTEYTPEELQGKVSTYTAMEAIGISLAGIGGCTLLTGIILMTQADWQTHQTVGGVSVNTNDPVGGAGIICLAFGVPFTAAGTVLGIIGAKKKKEYKWRMQLSDINIHITPQNSGCELVFNF